MSKIMFICGSMEPTKDGVGDYTRILGSELLKQGNKVAIIALADKHIESEWTGIQHFENIGINVLRLPFSAPWSDRLQTAKKFTDDFNPEWLSLQFVLFSFHQKGFPLLLANKIRQIKPGANWHVMFHEIWAGMNREASVKSRITGSIQKQIISSFINALKPKLIHTQSQVYKMQLEGLRKNIAIKHLPLFANISNNMVPANAEPASKTVTNGHLVFSVFGSISIDAPIDEFAEELLLISKTQNLKPRIKILGRFNPQQNRWITAFKAKGIDAELLGNLTTEQVSEELHSSHYGLNTTPKLLTEKSGSIAAMLAHGLPVICITKSWSLKGSSNSNSISDNIHEYKPGNLSLIFNRPVQKNISRTPRSIASQFIQDILIGNKH